MLRPRVGALRRSAPIAHCSPRRRRRHAKADACVTRVSTAGTRIVLESVESSNVFRPHPDQKSATANSRALPEIEQINECKVRTWTKRRSIHCRKRCSEHSDMLTATSPSGTSPMQAVSYNSQDFMRPNAMQLLVGRPHWRSPLLNSLRSMASDMAL